MDFFRNFPFFCIIITMVSAVITSIMSDKVARYFNVFIVSIVAVMSFVTFIYTRFRGDSFTYYMGHFSAPWGNEIRVGQLEAITATFFSVIMLASVIGGMNAIIAEVKPKKQNLYYIMVNLILASLLTLIYTNDLFTAYVFIEIMTIGACGLILAKDNGHCLVAAAKYMIMSLIGSGLILIGLSLLYDLSGHLLMSNIKEVIQANLKSGDYILPFIVTVGLICIGLAIKSALFPFHSWLPDAYGYSTATSSALLSSLVSKGYIFLLIKIIYRVIGFEVIKETGIGMIFFVYGIIAMIIGSIRALKQTDIRRMIAYSSIAQIGYIFMGMGIGKEVAMVASIFHIFAHASAKSMMFIAADGLTHSSGDSKEFEDLGGSAIKNPIAGITFTVGAFSMIGIPFFAGFISKVCFADAALSGETYMTIIVMLALAISTMLNAAYFTRAIITIYKPVQNKSNQIIKKASKGFAIACIIFILINIVLGAHAQPIIDSISFGLSLFS